MLVDGRYSVDSVSPAVPHSVSVVLVRAPSQRRVTTTTRKLRCGRGVPYHWNPGWDLEVDLVLLDGTTIGHDIEAPQQSPGFGTDVLWTLALVGLFVGVIPVALGMLWFPFIRSMGDRWLHAILVFAAGVLAFLAVDAGFEALELAEQVPSAFEGTALVALGVFGAFLSVQAIGSWREGRADAGDVRARAVSGSHIS